jgi:hypothetical protein
MFKFKHRPSSLFSLPPPLFSAARLPRDCPHGPSMGGDNICTLSHTMSRHHFPPTPLRQTQACRTPSSSTGVSPPTSLTVVAVGSGPSAAVHVLVCQHVASVNIIIILAYDIQPCLARSRHADLTTCQICLFHCEFSELAISLTTAHRTTPPSGSHSYSHTLHHVTLPPSWSARRGPKTSSPYVIKPFSTPFHSRLSPA